MFRSDSDRRDMACVVRFKQADYETRHRAVLGYDTVGDGFRRAEQVLKSVATVGFAIKKASLIQMPALIDLAHRQRAHVVVRVRGRHER